jgi:hypothetical protein
MKKLEKIISLLLKIVELLPILIELLKALDRDTNVIKSKLDMLDIQIEDIKHVTEDKQNNSLIQNYESENKLQDYKC